MNTGTLANYFNVIAKIMAIALVVTGCLIVKTEYSDLSWNPILSHAAYGVPAKILESIAIVAVFALLALYLWKNSSGKHVILMLLYVASLFAAATPIDCAISFLINHFGH